MRYPRNCLVLDSSTFWKRRVFPVRGTNESQRSPWESDRCQIPRHLRRSEWPIVQGRNRRSCSGTGRSVERWTAKTERWYNDRAVRSSVDLTFRSLCITFPEWMYLIALNSWYMMKTLWMFCRMLPFLMTLWRSVSGETGRKVFQAKCLRIAALRDLREFFFFFGPGLTHPCTRTRDICPGRCSPCADRSVVWCSRDWRTTVGTLFHGTSSARPSGFEKRRRSIFFTATVSLFFLSIAFHTMP